MEQNIVSYAHHIYGIALTTATVCCGLIKKEILAKAEIFIQYSIGILAVNRSIVYNRYIISAIDSCW